MLRIYNSFTECNQRGKRRQYEGAQHEITSEWLYFAGDFWNKKILDDFTFYDEPTMLI